MTFTNSAFTAQGFNETFLFKFREKDPRSNAFFLSSTPYPSLFIVGLYLYLVYSLIPRYMQNRAPYKLDRFVILYNSVQILLNLYMVYLGCERLSTLNWFCSPVDYGDTPLGWTDLRKFRLFFIVKILDLTDTIIFVLRKKPNQVTTLHVFHHVMMVGSCWFGMAYWGGGHLAYMALVNALVHTILYFYYLLTVWKPEQKSSMWWKKHLTQLQIVQFGFYMVTYGQVLFRPSCDFSKISAACACIGSVIMTAMFGNFYYKAYVQPSVQQKKKHE